MIFFKKQHEDIAIGFLQRIDLMLRHERKAVLGYSIDEGVETLKLRVGGAVIELKIEGHFMSYNQPIVPSPAGKDPVSEAEKKIEEAKAEIY